MSDPLAMFKQFEDLGAADREQLEGYLEERTHAAGDRLFPESDESNEALLLLEGSVEVESQERVCGILRAGSLLGGVSLVVIGSRECSAKALEDVRLYALTREAYLRMRVEAPALALQVQESILRSFAGAVRGLLSAIDEPAAPAS